MSLCVHVCVCVCACFFCVCAHAYSLHGMHVWRSEDSFMEFDFSPLNSRSLNKFIRFALQTPYYQLSHSAGPLLPFLSAISSDFLITHSTLGHLSNISRPTCGPSIFSLTIQVGKLIMLIHSCNLWTAEIKAGSCGDQSNLDCNFVSCVHFTN